MDSKIINRMITIIFIIVGIIFIMLGFYMYKQNTSFINKAVATEGVVIKTKGFKVTGLYNNKNITFLNIKNNLKPNDKINIYCNSKTKTCKSASSNDLSIFFVVVGIVIFILNTLALFIINKKDKKEDKIIHEEKNIIKGNIIGVEKDTTIESEGKNPYIIVCSYLDQKENVEKHCKSEDLWFDAKKIIEEKQIKTLPIYIDKDNPDDYSIDVSVLINDDERI